jgi:hypothetical protein
VLDLLVPCQSIKAAEALLVVADLAAHLLAVVIVDGILMTSQIVRTREDCVTRLSCGGIETSATVRARLA